jgi:hypothetical protein
MASKDAMDALMRIEGFRSLNNDIETIINLTDKVKKAKAKGDKLSPKEKAELSDEENEYKSKRKLIQEKLIKFATRVPVFMYLTDFREYSLRDVITQLEPGLFKRVTGLDVKDFELLISLGVFNGALMNDAVYKFKRYEDASLSYTGIDKHIGQAVGGYDTVLTREEFEKLYGTQQLSMTAAVQTFEDLPNIDFGDGESEVAENTPKVTNPSKGKMADKPTAIVFSYAPVQPKLVTPIYMSPIVKSEQKPKIEIDTSKIKVGGTVMHKTFGKGIVRKIAGDKITITFGTAEKLFLFPSSFENGFLTIGGEA